MLSNSEEADSGYEVNVDEEAAFAAAPAAPATKDEEEAKYEVTTQSRTLAASANIEFVDHFSLKQSASNIRFRNKHVRIYELSNDQLQLESETIVLEGSDGETSEQNPRQRQIITVKRMPAATFGLRVLRAIYTLVSLLMLGFLFVFASQVIIFQILEIPKHDGDATDHPLDINIVLATIFSLPLLVYSMGSFMVLGTIFVGDTWSGHPLFGMLLSLPKVAIEWLSFIMYIAIPGLAAIITEFAGFQNWWEVTSLVWVACMTISFFCFCAMVLYYELKLCYDLMKTQCSPDMSVLHLVRKTLITTLTQRFAGVQYHKYLVESNNASTILEAPDTTAEVSTSMGLYSRFTTWSCNVIFVPLDPPQRRYSIEEILETLPVVTNKSWSLEKACCRPRYGRTLSAASGEEALDRSHFISTLVCSLLGVCIGVLILVGFLVWMGQGATVVIVVAVVLFICCGGPVIVSAGHLFRNMPNKESESNVDDTALYHVWQSTTVTKPREWYCWFRLLLDMVFLFLWPMAALYANDLPRNGSLFLVVGLISGLRIHFDAR